MADTSKWWNIVQACVWVATREKSFVDRVWFSGARYSTAETISNRSLLDASIDVSVEQADQREKSALTVSAARTHIADACAAGDIVMYGRPRGAGDLEQLPQVVWGNLEIRDHDDYGVVAASTDMFDRKASWWDELKVSRADVERLWPDGTAEPEANAEPSIQVGSTAPKRSGSQTAKATQAEHDAWMITRVGKLRAAGGQSNTTEDEIAARAEPPEGLGPRSDRAMVRIARKNHAPKSWQKTDVRRQK